MQLHPRERFVITRQLNDPADVGTYYVRVVIRNAKTDTILETLNLTDRGGQRFTREWRVPADPSGQGFYITAVTTVYTNSGYTVKSTTYGEEACTYLIQERYVFNPNYPTGPDIDYKRIKKMIDESVAAIRFPDIPKPERINIPTVDVDSPIRSLKKDIISALSSIKIPESTDVSPVLEKIDGLSRIIPSIKQEILSEVREELRGVLNSSRDSGQASKAGLDRLAASISRVEKKIADFDLRDLNLEQLNLQVSDMGDMFESKKSPEETKKDPRITRLIKR